MGHSKQIFELLLFLSFSVVSSNIGMAQSDKLNISSPEFTTTVDSIVHRVMKQYAIPGIAIGLVMNDSIMYTRGYGVSKIGDKNPIGANSIFHTASISKIFTALAVMQLVKDDKLAINDKLIYILPELNYTDNRVKEISIKNLLNHTAGLPDIKNYNWKNNNQSQYSLKDYIFGLKLKLLSAPSDKYRYSNLGYDILGYVVESVSGVAFEEYVKTMILDPNGMANSDFRYFLIPDPLRVSPHSKKGFGQKVYTRKIYPYTREHAPSSTLNASVEDLSNWMVSFLGQLKHEASAEHYETMLEPSFSQYLYTGLGFQLFDFENHKAVGHFGGDRGFRSLLLMIPEEQIGLVVLGNCDYDDDYRQEIIYPIANLMLTTNMVEAGQ